MRNFHLIANTGSGHGKAAEFVEAARGVCAEHGFKLVHHKTESKEDFERCSREAVELALVDKGIVAAAGGDGTIRGVAEAARGTGVHFAVIPIGTFNFFARAHKIPEDSLAALRAALTGTPTPVRLGEINERTFLVNASLGLYAKAIRERERSTSRFGRHRLVVIASTLVSMMRPHRQLKVDLVNDGQLKCMRTPMVFIGNNALQLRDLAMDVAGCMKKNLLAVVIMKPATRLDRLRVLAHSITKSLENEKGLETFCVQELVIHTQQSSHEIALDGEIFRLSTPLRVRAMPGALNLLLKSGAA